MSPDKSRIKCLTSLIVILLPVFITSCNKFYISSSGSDEASGRSPRSAWKSIEKVNSMDFSPGDEILFEGGEVFEGSLKFDIHDSGNRDEPVSVSSYGKGRATIRSDREHGLYAHNTSGFVVKDLIFSGPGAHVDQQVNGIYFYTDMDTVKPEFIRIDHVEVSGYRWDGIRIYGEKNGSSGFRDIRITHAEVHDNGDKGISVGGPQPPGDWGHKNVYIGYCRVFNIRGISGKKGHSGNGIIVSSVDTALIEYSTAFNNGEFSDDPETGGPIGIWYWDTRNGIIQHCESFRNKTGNRADGGGFDLDGGCVNCIMQYNYSHDNHGAGYGIYQYRNAREFVNNVVRYNISVNDGLNNHHGGINLWSTNSSGGMRNTQIYHNTIIVTDSTRGAAIGEIPDDTDTSYIYNTEIYNNIFNSVGSNVLIDIPYPGAEWTFMGNCYLSSEFELRTQWGDNLFQDLDSWRSATGQEQLDGQPTGLLADPDVGIPESTVIIDDMGQLHLMEAYRLKSGSTLIDAAIDISTLLNIDVGQTDFFGTIIPVGRGYDIGAHEFKQ